MGAPLSAPTPPAVSWMKRSIAWCCLRMPQVGSCNGPSIPRRNSSAGEKENGLLKRRGFEAGNAFAACVLRGLAASTKDAH